VEPTSRSPRSRSGSAAHHVFLATTRPDGNPLAAGVGVGWHEGDLYFNSGPGTRKARNLAADDGGAIRRDSVAVRIIRVDAPSTETRRA